MSNGSERSSKKAGSSNQSGSDSLSMTTMPDTFSASAAAHRTRSWCHLAYSGQLWMNWSQKSSMRRHRRQKPLGVTPTVSAISMGTWSSQYPSRCCARASLSKADMNGSWQHT